MEFLILGHIEVRDGDREVTIGGPKQRALLAILLLRANETVSRDRLIDDLWGERPPGSAAHTLESYVHRLRRALGDEGAALLSTRATGYRLEVAPGALDLDRFMRLAAEGQGALAGGSYDRAASKLREALAIWRGSPLADLADEPFARVEADRLEELRLAALEDRIDAELALGGHAALVAELQRLVAGHPLRERFRSQLMLALYRSGRQAEALDAYHDAREYMVGELGIEPGKQLRDLNDAILNQDEALEPARGEPLGSVATLEPPAGRPPQSSPTLRTALPEAPGRPAAALPRRPSRRLLIALGCGAVALAALVTWLLIDDHDGLDSAAVDSNAALFVSTDDRELVEQTPIGGRPAAIAADADAIWIADASASEAVKLDSESHAIVDRVPIRDEPTALAIADGRLWVASATGGAVYEIDPEVDRVVARVAVGSAPTAIAAGEGAVWVADANDGTVRRIDPGSARVTATARTSQRLSDVTVGLGAVWATSAPAGVLVRIDPETARPTESVPVGNSPASVAVAGDAVWVSNPTDGTVSRVDPSTADQSKVAVDHPGELAATADLLWVAEPGIAELAGIDVDSGGITTELQTGSPATALTAGAGGLVAATGPAASAHRGGTLRLAGGDSLFSIDPGFSYSLAAWELVSVTSRGLVTYAREPGPAGSEIVPAMATSVPAPTDRGRTYTFQLRPDLRYSTGAEVRPQDFRTALERQFVSFGGMAQLGVPIVGGPGCTQHPARCDLSRGVQVDATARTVTYHLTEPDPSFLYELALPFGAPVPAGSPTEDAGRRALPATGPYQVESYTPGRRLTLVRNPNYEANGGAPIGFVDRLDVQLGTTPLRQVQLVRSGAADLTLDSPPTSVVPRLLRQDPAATQVYVSPTDLAMFLNTRQAPFDDLRVRRAVNLAVDRAAVARLGGGRELARPSCQILPVGFPGYAPYCPYTARASATGSWVAPDRPRARRLIAASGTAGMRLTVAATADTLVPPKAARYFVRLLDGLGYRADLRMYPSDHTYYSSVADPRSGIAAGPVGWVADFPAASSFFAPLFTCRAARGADSGFVSPSHFCDRGLDARIRRAEALQATSPAAADAAWQRIDRAVTDQAPWVSLYNPRSVDYLGSRVGNYQRHPEFGVLLDRVWVR